MRNQTFTRRSLRRDQCLQQAIPLVLPFNFISSFPYLPFDDFFTLVAFTGLVFFTPVPFLAFVIFFALAAFLTLTSLFALTFFGFALTGLAFELASILFLSAHHEDVADLTFTFVINSPSL